MVNLKYNHTSKTFIPQLKFYPSFPRATGIFKPHLFYWNLLNVFFQVVSNLKCRWKKRIFLNEEKNMIQYSLPRFHLGFITYFLFHFLCSLRDACTDLRLLKKMLDYRVLTRRDFQKLKTLFLSVCHAWERINYVCPQFLLKVLNDEKTLHNFLFPLNKIYESL